MADEEQHEEFETVGGEFHISNKVYDLQSDQLFLLVPLSSRCLVDLPYAGRSWGERRKGSEGGLGEDDLPSK